MIDGGIDGERLRKRAPTLIKERGEDGLLDIDAIAEPYWQIHRDRVPHGRKKSTCVRSRNRSERTRASLHSASSWLRCLPFATTHGVLRRAMCKEQLLVRCAGLSSALAFSPVPLLHSEC